MSFQKHCLTKCQLFDEIYLFLEKDAKSKESNEVIAVKLSDCLFDKMDKK